MSWSLPTAHDDEPAQQPAGDPPAAHLRGDRETADLSSSRRPRTRPILLTPAMLQPTTRSRDTQLHLGEPEHHRRGAEIPTNSLVEAVLVIAVIVGLALGIQAFLVKP